jgi:ABC-type transport system involved in cytochrome c biogenesis permease component
MVQNYGILWTVWTLSWLLSDTRMLRQDFANGSETQWPLMALLELNYSPNELLWGGLSVWWPTSG